MPKIGFQQEAPEVWSRRWRPRLSASRPGALLLRSELERVLHRCPPLADAYAPGSALNRALQRLLALPAGRPLESWLAPTIGDAQGALASLARHRLARYPVPDVLWNGLFAPTRQAEFFVPLVVAVASGGSLSEHLRTSTFPVPLTRFECHALLQSPPSVAFLEAIRRVQARRLSPAVTEELLGTEWGRELFVPAIESAWSHWVEWLSRQPRVPPHRVGPLSDFVIGQLPDGFSLKGRTVASLEAAMESWHEGLAQAQFRPRPEAHREPCRSGFAGAAWIVERQGFVESWSVIELDTSPALLVEGRQMHHCVFDYQRRIWSGRCSIWSLGLQRPEGRKRFLTIEVRNAEREVVQVRGPCNRRPLPEELELVRHWVQLAGLTLGGRIIC